MAGLLGVMWSSAEARGGVRWYGVADGDGVPVRWFCQCAGQGPASKFGSGQRRAQHGACTNTGGLPPCRTCLQCRLAVQMLRGPAPLFRPILVLALEHRPLQESGVCKLGCRIGFRAAKWAGHTWSPVVPYLATSERGSVHVQGRGVHLVRALQDSQRWAKRWALPVSACARVKLRVATQYAL